MSYVPASSFDNPIASGYPVNEGACTMLTNSPIRTYVPDKSLVIPTSGVGVPGIPGFFSYLDTKFLHTPSGWNASH